jgi:predicted site-specific integrase-resolvase
MAGEGDDLVPLQDAAKLLDVSVATLYRWTKEGRLQAVKANPALKRQKAPLRYRRRDLLALKGEAEKQ